MKYTKGEREYTFEMDIDYIMDLEAKDKNFSITDIFKTFENGRFRFTELNILTQFVGAGTYIQFRESGLDLSDLGDIINGCFEELGFISKEDASD